MEAKLCTEMTETLRKNPIISTSLNVNMFRAFACPFGDSH